MAAAVGARSAVLIQKSSSPIASRTGVAPRLGTLVAELPKAARSSVIAVEDLAVTGPGTWCYAVFTLDRRNRWRSAGERIVARGPEAPLAKQSTS